jgi:hypothetical protein
MRLTSSVLVSVATENSLYGASKAPRSRALVLHTAPTIESDDLPGVEGPAELPCSGVEIDIEPAVIVGYGLSHKGSPAARLSRCSIMNKARNHTGLNPQVVGSQNKLRGSRRASWAPPD